MLGQAVRGRREHPRAISRKCRRSETNTTHGIPPVVQRPVSPINDRPEPGSPAAGRRPHVDTTNRTKATATNEPVTAREL